MTKQNIARSGESADAFERPSESPERGALMEERFPTNYSVLLAGPPGVGKFEYLIARIREDLRLGERVVFVTLDMPPNEIRARAKALRLDLGAHEGRSFVFVDCYSATSSDRPEAAPGKKTFLVSSFSNLEGIGMAMSKAGQEIGTPVRIYFYTVSTLFLHNSTQAIAKFLPDRHIASEDEPRLHSVRGPRRRPRTDDDEPVAIPRRRRRRDALHGRNGTRGPGPPHARVPGRRVVASVRPTPGGGNLAMMQSPPKAMAPRAKTGIPVLDYRLQGGLPPPSTLLLYRHQPTEKRLFGQNFAIQGVKAGETCVYVDFFRAPR